MPKHSSQHSISLSVWPSDPEPTDLRCFTLSLLQRAEGSSKVFTAQRAPRPLANVYGTPRLAYTFFRRVFSVPISASCSLVPLGLGRPCQGHLQSFSACRRCVELVFYACECQHSYNLSFLLLVKLAWRVALNKQETRVIIAALSFEVALTYKAACRYVVI